MKRLLASCASAAILFVSLQAVAPAATQAPNAAQMAPLQYLLGTWHCSWTAGTASGAEDQVFVSALNGAWLQESEVVQNASGQPFVRSVHYTGYDPAKKLFMHLGPDADGSYEIAQSVDTNVWQEPSGSFYHTKISDTERAESESYQANGKTVTFHMSCKKAP